MYENSMGPADMAAVMGNRGGAYGGMGFGGGAWWWIIILFLFGMNGGWGRGFGGYGNGGCDGVGSEVQRGFDQNAVMSGINGLNGAVANGFANVQTALCNGFAGVNQGMANGFAQAEISENARQMANMNQMFGLQTGLSNQLNTIAMNQQQCCCENRAATADLKYTVANEACADRAAVEGALRDVTAQGVANTQALLNTINGGIQSLKDQMYADKMDAKNEKIADLQQQLAMKDLYASQIAQDGRIIDGVYNRLATCPVDTTPVYGHQPIFRVQQNQGCPCGYAYGA